MGTDNKIYLFFFWLTSAQMQAVIGAILQALLASRLETSKNVQRLHQLHGMAMHISSPR